MCSQQFDENLFFEPRVLKNVVNKAKKQVVQAQQNDEETIFRFFVARDSFASAFDSSIDPLKITKESSEAFYKIELYPLQKRLRDIQQHLESNLRTIIGGARGGTEPSDVSVLAETPQYYILYDKLYIIHESLEAEYEIPYTVVEAHRSKAAQVLGRLDPDIPSSDVPLWIIQKPPNWYAGQWTVLQTISHFLQCGMSPTEAIDYYIVRILNAPVHYWATVREKNKDTIYNHVRKAENKIDPQAHPTEPSEYDYTGRTYENAYVGDIEYMTVDNGFLHPRRDIMNASLSGKMTSGYSGAGPKQLAVAILADLFGDDQADKLAQELMGQLQQLASSDEDGTWQLSEEQLQQWYWSR